MTPRLAPLIGAFGLLLPAPLIMQDQATVDQEWPRVADRIVPARVMDDAATQTPTPKVLVIGIDGVRPDILEAAATPNIDALAGGGFYTAQAQTGFPTVSGPGWSSLLSGVWSDKHGVTDNSFSGARYEEHPDFLTRLEKHHPALNTFAVANWTPLFETPADFPLIGLAVDTRHVLDGAQDGWAETDEVAVRLAAEAIRAGDPDALFVYLGNPDETSHHTGDIGIEYRKAIETADQHVGTLIAAVRSRATATAEDWLTLISTDHGRTVEGGHGGSSPEEKTIFFLAHGPSVRPAEGADPVQIVDVAVTAMAHMGVELDASLDGRVVGLAR